MIAVQMPGPATQRAAFLRYGIDAPYVPAALAAVGLEAVTARNARAEGVSDRVDLHTGDMTALEFDDASFSVVTSSLASHDGSHRDEVVRPGRRRGRMSD